MPPRADQSRAFDSDLNDPPTSDAKPENGRVEIDLTDIRIMTQASSVFYALTSKEWRRRGQLPI
jgi:hypothetical protein